MLLRIFGACALALALLITISTGAAQAAGYPLVRGKCGCLIGWDIYWANCGSERVTCTKKMCAAACQAAMPKKSSDLQITDVSAARRVHRGRVPPIARNPDSMGGRRYASHQSRAAASPRPAKRMETARPSQIDRDGRGYASTEARVSAPVRTVTHRRAAGVARAAVQGAAIGGQVAVEHARPADCYGIAWCGCFLRHVFGLPDRTLNLAIAWAKVGSPAAPQEANVVVWRHHVAQVLSHAGGQILIRSGNDRGAVRTRWVSPRILGGVVAWRRV